MNLQLKNCGDDFKQYYIEDNGEDKFEFIELTGVDDENLDKYIEEFLENPFEELFDKPLYKIGIIKTLNSLILVGAFQHSLVDGTSLFSIFPREISKCMDALKNDEEYEKISKLSYETYVDREKEYLKSPEFIEDKKYWLDNLEDYKQDWYSFENLDLGTYEFKFDEGLTNDLMKFSNVKGTRISPFVLALSVVSLYFAKSKSLKNIIWNTSISGRYFGEDISQLLGMFTNTIPLKMVYDEDLSFEDLLLSAKNVLKEGLTHGKIQFNEYSSDLRNNGVDPGVITMYSIVSNSTDYETNFMTLQKDTEFPFHIRVNKNYSDKKGLQSLFIEYNKNCFSLKQIKEIANGIELLLHSILEDSTKSCKDYDVEVNEFFKAETYFKELITSFDNPTIISPDVYGKKTDSQFNLKRLEFDEEQVSKIGYYINSRDLSVKEFLYGILMFNLTKYSFSKDILVSTSSFRNILGNNYLNDFNELAIAYKFNTNKNIIEYLTDFKFRLTEIFNYSFYPLINNNSLSFDSEILFNYFDDSLPEYEYDNIDYFSSLISEDIDLDKFKLIFSIVNDEDYLRLDINYDSSLYSDELINSFMESTSLLLDNFLEDDKKLLKNISIAKKTDTEFNIDLVNEAVIDKIFEGKVKENPDKTILYGTDGELTYSQLNKKANKIANALLSRGVKVEDKVMLLMERNTDLIASVLGVVKAGAAFIPVDPNYPAERVNQILDDSDSKFIIISDNVDYTSSNTINVNELLEYDDDTNPLLDLSPDNLCFIIYTSGSTGKPKGVMLTHNGISNYAVNHQLNIPIYALNNNCTKMISISTVSFIVFLREIFGTILNGLPVVFANEEEAINPLKLAELFHKTNADAFGSTPTRLLEYLKFPEIQEVISKCKCIIIGGEGFPPRLYDELRKYTKSEIYNSYGPTEVTIASHGKLIESNNITAGYPMLNVTDKIMDIDANELPPYVTGEIYVGGAGIARGYYNNPELTNKVFMQINNTPFYNTGDLGKKDDNGELYVLGRNDTQIKLRGLRIELSEIEGNIAEYENISSVAVTVKEIKSTEYLCAYYTKKDPNKEIDKEELRTYLQEQLPDYMVPHYLEELNKFPTTPNGKTDFKNLPTPKIEKDEHDYTPPKTEPEKQLTKILQKILEIDKISVNTDLFTIGLTSLTVIKLSSTIFEELKSELNVVDLINAKTIRKIGELIESSQTKNTLEEESNYKLTPNQLGIYFECVKNPEKLGYNLPKKIIFDNTVNPTQLKESIIKAINKHPYLKNRIIIEDGDVFNSPYDGEINEIEIEEIQELNT